MCLSLKSLHRYTPVYWLPIVIFLRYMLLAQITAVIICRVDCGQPNGIRDLIDLLSSSFIAVRSKLCPSSIKEVDDDASTNRSPHSEQTSNSAMSMVKSRISAAESNGSTSDSPSKPSQEEKSTGESWSTDEEDDDAFEINLEDGVWVARSTTRNEPAVRLERMRPTALKSAFTSKSRMSDDSSGNCSPSPASPSLFLATAASRSSVWSHETYREARRPSLWKRSSLRASRLWSGEAVPPSNHLHQVSSGMAISQCPKEMLDFVDRPLHTLHAGGSSRSHRFVQATPSRSALST